jgi:hypothetical protein
MLGGEQTVDRQDPYGNRAPTAEDAERGRVTRNRMPRAAAPRYMKEEK